jgi:hypothetical protein
MTYLHEKIPTEAIRAFGISRQQSSHFIETFRDPIDVNEPRDVLVVAKVPKESKLAQSAFRERRLCEYARNHLDRNGLTRDLVCG